MRLWTSEILPFECIHASSTAMNVGKLPRNCDSVGSRVIVGFWRSLLYCSGSPTAQVLRRVGYAWR